MNSLEQASLPVASPDAGFPTPPVQRTPSKQTHQRPRPRKEGCLCCLSAVCFVLLHTRWSATFRKIHGKDLSRPVFFRISPFRCCLSPSGLGSFFCFAFSAVSVCL